MIPPSILVSVSVSRVCGVYGSSHDGPAGGTARAVVYAPLQRAPL